MTNRDEMEELSEREKEWREEREREKKNREERKRGREKYWAEREVTKREFYDKIAAQRERLRKQEKDRGMLPGFLSDNVKYETFGTFQGGDPRAGFHAQTFRDTEGKRIPNPARVVPTGTWPIREGEESDTCIIANDCMFQYDLQHILKTGRTTKLDLKMMRSTITRRSLPGMPTHDEKMALVEKWEAYYAYPSEPESEKTRRDRFSGSD